METNKEITNKKSYLLPKMEQVLLDNEIALALESSPPAGPSEVSIQPDTLTKDPFNKLA